MKKFVVEVVERNVNILVIEAESQEEAFAKAKAMQVEVIANAIELNVMETF